jgi:hypothetical protein
VVLPTALSASARVGGLDRVRCREDPVPGVHRGEVEGNQRMRHQPGLLDGHLRGLLTATDGRPWCAVWQPHARRLCGTCPWVTR